MNKESQATEEANTQDLAKEVQEQAFQGGKNAVPTYDSSIKAPEAPKMELPKGGGALRSIGEKFEANPVTGTANISVPIAMSPGRNGFQPQISLSYNSGGGNGIFGMGWGMGLASISRKTQKGLPIYQDDKDVFLLAGAEDLVPMLGDDASYENADETHNIQRYRPRVEGSFLKIERWTDQTSKAVHWRVTDKNNVVSVFGESQAAQVYDSENARKIFEWKIERRYDALGNVIEFEYKRENAEKVSNSPSEYNRIKNDNAFNQLYPKKIKYGNTEMYDSANWGSNDWHFELVFDYGEHSGDPAAYVGSEDWLKRQDPFSSFRSGFDIRTYRLCRRILLYHRFSGLNSGSPFLVKSTELTYDENPIGTQLQSVLHRGYDVISTGSMPDKAMPPISFSYTQAEVNQTIQTLKESDTENLPFGIDGENYSWADPKGEGIQGILTESANAWYFKPNYGHDNFYQDHPATYSPEPLVSFGKLQTLNQKPNGAAAASLQDIDGDGLQEAVMRAPGMAGFYKQNHEGEWTHFQHFDAHPNLNFQDENVKMVDLNGDGRADILITEHDHIEWIPYEDSDIFVAKDKRKVKPGYGYRRKISKALEEDDGPRLVFSNGKQNIFLSDMTGDGFSDLLRIENGSIDYWPHLGYGHFGPKVSLANVRTFDHPDQFDARRIRLGDIDGSGTTDIIYLGRSYSKYFINQSGNALSNGVFLHSLPRTDSLQNVQLVDILGNGTSCLVWSSPHDKDKPYHIKYIDLMGGKKPYLLEEMDNGMGALRKFAYAPSTKFYLRDQRAGKPWITKLPFPVQCLERVEIFEQITQSRYVSRYAYHHGYFDPVEREFRGFGMVEQWDSELYEDFAEAALYQVGSNALEEESHSPPVYTKSLFHNGQYGVSLSGAEGIESHYATEYWNEDETAFSLAGHQFPENSGGEALRQAYRALKGSLLRQEVYALNQAGENGVPYVVSESRYAVKEVQAMEDERFGVYRTEQKESFSYQYEQDAADPRISQQLLLESDAYGNPLKTATVAYPRRGSGHESEQMQAHIVVQENDFINFEATPDGSNILNDATYRIGALSQETVWEYRPQSFSAPLLAADLLQDIGTAAIVAVENDFSGSQNELRLLGKAKMLYYSQDLTTALSLGSIAKHGLPHHSEQLAFTDNLVDEIYNDGTPKRIDLTTQTDQDLLTNAGYSQQGSEWWLPSGNLLHDDTAFYLPQSSIDAFGKQSDFSYDAYSLFPEQITDPLGNESHAEINYVHLQPTLLTDPNGNRQEVIMDALGMPLKIMMMGKDSSHADYSADEGDTTAEPSQEYSYDLNAFAQTGTPIHTEVVLRDTHYLESNNNDLWRKEVSYFDGLGNPIQQRMQFGEWAGTEGADTPVAVSGRQIKNNKDLVIEQYEPYLETGFDYAAAADDSSMARIRLHYDALGRNTQIDYDDGTFEKVEFTAWQQKNYDRNDTVVDSSWYSSRNSPNPTGSEPTDKDERAAWLAAKHYDTPQLIELDSLGRVFRTRDDNGSFNGTTTTNIYYDVRVQLSIDSKQEKVTNALNQDTVFKYNLLPLDKDGNGMITYTDSPDGGWRRSLQDVAGNMVLAWDERGHEFRNEYDDLRRIRKEWIKPSGGVEFLNTESIYGESEGSVKNHNTQIYQLKDQSGILTFEEYDFKGNLIENKREFASVYDTNLDWSGTVSLESESFISQLNFDALNRPTLGTKADGTEEYLSYNRAALLVEKSIKVRGTGTVEDVITDIHYNVRGQRTDIFYANASKSKYEYNDATFRLERLLTTRNTGTDVLQDLNYTFDAVGNIVELVDDAQQTHYFQNSVVVPKGKYEYDALYRLIKASGREHAGQGQTKENDIDLQTPVPHANQSDAVINYTETYEYDEIGNIEKLTHTALNNNWTRGYDYDSSSNYLLKTSLPGDTITDPSAYSSVYTYDVHGNMKSMPHLNDMIWNANDQLTEVDLGSAGTAYYRYDVEGNRIRKVIENGSSKKERIYLDGVEIWREYSSGVVQKERETLSISDESKVFLRVETLTTDGGTPISSPTSNFRYQYANHLESACLELDDSANIISYEEYHPFGSSSYRSGDNAAEVSLKRYKYNGKEQDDETGLYNYGMRFYSAWLCRFVSVDPLKDDYPHYTTYQYAGNKPITYIDLDGLEEADPTSQFPSLINKNESLIYFGSNGLNWNTDNISKPLLTSISRPILKSKKEFELPSRTGGKSIDIEIEKLDIDNYVNKIKTRNSSGLGYVYNKSESLNPKSYNSTPYITDWSRLDKRYNTSSSKNPFTAHLNASSSKVGNWLFVAEKALEIFAEIYSDIKIEQDVELASRQLAILNQASEMVANAEVSGVIPFELQESNDYSDFRLALINKVFSGNSHDNFGSIIFNDKEGNERWLSDNDYQQLINQVAKDILNYTFDSKTEQAYD